MQNKPWCNNPRIVWSEPGDPSKRNQDVGGLTNHWAWVLDGATPLIPGSVTPEGDDTYWFVQQIHRHLLTTLEGMNQPLDDYFRELLAQLAHQYHHYAGILQDLITDYPSASVGLIQKDRNQLNYWLLGDCSMAILYPNQQVYYVYQDHRLAVLDRRVLQAEKWLPLIGLDDSESQRLKFRQGLLNHHRSLIHQKNGI